MLELLKEHPKTALVIKQWLLEKMLESLNDESLPEDFKTFVREQGIDDDKVAKMLEGSPRALFDIFDSHKIYVETVVDDTDTPKKGFWWKIGETKSSCGFEFRVNCDKQAIIEAFKLLEEKI